MAVKSFFEFTVKMLLEREDVNPNQADSGYWGGHMPLTRAAMSGHKEVVKMLLEREGVNPNQADNKFGRTPLFWAAIIRTGMSGGCKASFATVGYPPCHSR